MKGSTWNHGASIPVSDLTESELKEAIHEWAEGCDSLEELLWLCNQNGLETNGCDAGNHHFAYIDFLLKEENAKLMEIMSAAWNYGKCNFFCLFFGNPRSGRDWYKTVINLSPRKNADAVPLFNELCSVLKKEKSVSESQVCKKLLELIEFLDDKEADITMHMNKKADSLYHFYFKAFSGSHNVEYFTKLFSNLGYTEVKSPNKPIIAWEFETTDEKELEEFLKKTLEVFKCEWSLELPNEPTEDMDFNSIALVMRRKFGTDDEGIKKFNEWLKINWRKPFKEMIF